MKSRHAGCVRSQEMECLGRKTIDRVRDEVRARRMRAIPGGLRSGEGVRSQEGACRSTTTQGLEEMEEMAQHWICSKASDRLPFCSDGLDGEGIDHFLYVISKRIEDRAGTARIHVLLNLDPALGRCT